MRHNLSSMDTGPFKDGESGFPNSYRRHASRIKLSAILNNNALSSALSFLACLHPFSPVSGIFWRESLQAFQDGKRLVITLNSKETELQGRGTSKQLRAEVQQNNLATKGGLKLGESAVKRSLKE